MPLYRKFMQDFKKEFFWEWRKKKKIGSKSTSQPIFMLVINFPFRLSFIFSFGFVVIFVICARDNLLRGNFSITQKYIILCVPENCGWKFRLMFSPGFHFPLRFRRNVGILNFLFRDVCFRWICWRNLSEIWNSNIFRILNFNGIRHWKIFDVQASW